MATLSLFDREARKVRGFVTACKLYLRMKMRGITVEKQMQWILTYIQGGAANVWKENVLEDLETGILEFETVREFLEKIKRRKIRRKKGRNQKKKRQQI